MGCISLPFTREEFLMTNRTLFFRGSWDGTDGGTVGTTGKHVWGRGGGLKLRKGKGMIRRQGDEGRLVGLSANRLVG